MSFDFGVSSTMNFVELIAEVQLMPDVCRFGFDDRWGA